MDRVGFVYLSGPRRGETVWVSRLPAALGSALDADVDVPACAPRHALLVQRGPDLVLQDGGSGLGTFFLGTRVREVVLHAGDVVELGDGGPVLRFARDTAVPAAETRPSSLTSARHRLSETAAMRVVQHTSRSFRWTLLSVLGASSLLLGWSWRESRRLEHEIQLLQQAMRHAEELRRTLEDRVDAERNKAEAERTRLEDARRREEELRVQIQQAAAGTVEALREQLRATHDRIETLESERAAGENIIRLYGGGVCLIKGSYAFYQAGGKALRVHVDQAGTPLKDDDGSPVLEAEGAGPLHSVEFYGTGFLVDAKGHILTNRHLAEPWWNDKEAQALEKQGYTPRFVNFRAYFPRHKEPFDLSFVRRSEKVDLALLRADIKGRRIPVLPLDRSRAGAVAGQPVVVVGYPTGLEALLAKAEASVVRQIVEVHGTSSEKLTEALSRRGLIRPSTTQGHIGDVTDSDIVFDAPTTQGGSGGPVFNKMGVVVAVEYAVLQRFGGNSFGIPIAFALDLLSPRAARPSRKT